MGDAGCIVTNRDDLAEWMTLFARHGGKGNHQIEGVNSRIDGLQAAILRTKLPHLGNWTECQQRAAGVYDDLLKSVEGVEAPKVSSNRNHVYHLYMIKTENRDALKTHLAENVISTVINYPRALPFYKAYDYLRHKPKDFPNAYANQIRILSSPMFPEITRQQQECVVEMIQRWREHQ